MRRCAASTRWHGTMTGTGLAPQAEPTARDAPGLAKRPAISPYERVWPSGRQNGYGVTVR
jgi:hypothetical protein